MPITTILFDLGGTLLDFDFGPINRRLAEASGLPVPEVKARTVERYQAFCRGEMAAAEWRGFVRDTFGLDLPPDEFRVFWADIFWPIDGLFDLARRTRPHYRQLLLSNTDEIHLPWCFERFAAEFDGLLDGMILSYEVGLMKPDRRIFDHAVERCGLVPTECVFIDDLAANVDGARAAGMHGVLCESPAQVERDLGALGVRTC